jgi:putative component of membrane protein insertase Oxa1/YidC/SpoIIIJ protein YidD
LQALKRYATFYAIKIIIIRLFRCNPWGGSGIDLLPKNNAKNKN